MVWKWLERRAAKQSLFNVGINTATLIAVSNRADAAIEKTAASNPHHMAEVSKAREALLTDINLALANGATTNEVSKKMAAVMAKETLSKGATLAVADVLNGDEPTFPRLS